MTTPPIPENPALRRLIVAKMLAVVLLAVLLFGGAAVRAAPAMAAHGSCRSGRVACGHHLTATCDGCPGTPTNAPIPGDCAQMTSCLAGAVFDVPKPVKGPAAAERGAPFYSVMVMVFTGRTIVPELSPPIAAA